MYLLDADWAISFLNGRANAVELIGELADEGICLSIITWGEIFEGLLSLPASSRRVAEFNQFVEALDLVTLDIEIARRYGSVRAQLRADGQLIADNDLWIAATALAKSYTLVSRDQHFTRVPGLNRIP